MDRAKWEKGYRPARTVPGTPDRSRAGRARACQRATDQALESAPRDAPRRAQPMHACVARPVVSRSESSQPEAAGPRERTDSKKHRRPRPHARRCFCAVAVSWPSEKAGRCRDPLGAPPLPGWGLWLMAAWPSARTAAGVAVSRSYRISHKAGCAARRITGWPVADAPTNWSR
jgi:hypothetical protein